MNNNPKDNFNRRDAEMQRKDFMLAKVFFHIETISWHLRFSASDVEKWNSLVSLTAEVVKALPCLRE